MRENENHLIDNLEFMLYRTYLKIIMDLPLDYFDIIHICRFYYAMTLYGAIGMMNEEARKVAYEEIFGYIGHFPYEKDIRDVFIKKYNELHEVSSIILKREKNIQTKTC